MAAAVDGAEAAALATDAEMREARGSKLYQCAQGVLFVKRSQDPSSTKIVQKSRHIGAKIYSTGEIWTGPGGGVWMECDAASGDYGWMLVKGPGFGLQGPALLACEHEENYYVEVYLLTAEAAALVLERLSTPDATVAGVKQWLQQRTGLNAKHCCLSNDLPPMNNGQRAGVDYMPEVSDSKSLRDLKKIEELGIKHVRFYLVYVGDYPDGFKMPPRTDIRVE
mmetsp:Transcript_31834/g.74385  ORF Transcript_31834/g.74385 Transcript_31834/m.74385 type:complete len:223 (+) Transcript_31834:84-752(+)|eukprot:CAMPEP_0178385596 /NCGR_PEP_ID=MMETSP0689_2-20121128/8112_1 /TAXON_ID=160604 /ORGANISM="Amphidinium massartii, Strain CS-259" /LENGTH=222 /DNA_ID=CAMNT_0020005879 /DNA_START=70 /DNA_END=738 /DNA_ORIENTATION=-